MEEADRVEEEEEVTHFFLEMFPLPEVKVLLHRLLCFKTLEKKKKKKKLARPSWEMSQDEASELRASERDGGFIASYTRDPHRKQNKQSKLILV